MRRSLSFKLFMAAFIAAVLGVTALVSSDLAAANAAQRTQHRAYKYHPPLLNNWGIQSDSQTTRFSIMLIYGGGGFINYRQIHQKADAIQMVKSILTLPKGASITKSRVVLSPPNNGKAYKRMKYWSKKSPSLNPKQLAAGGQKWLWRFRGLRSAPIVSWNFVVDWGSATDQCMKVIAHPMYYKRVKRGKRHFRVLKPIPHAPVQTGYSAACP